MSCDGARGVGRHDSFGGQQPGAFEAAEAAAVAAASASASPPPTSHKSVVKSRPADHQEGAEIYEVKREREKEREFRGMHVDENNDYF